MKAINSHIKFAILKIQRFAKIYAINIEDIVDYLIVDFAQVYFETKIGKIVKDNKLEQSKQETAVQCEALLHFLYQNNSYLLLSESEIVSFFEEAYRMAGDGENKIIKEKLRIFIFHLTVDLPLMKFKNILENQITSQQKSQMIPMPFTKMIKEVDWEKEMNTPFIQEETTQGYDESMVNSSLYGFSRSLAPLKKIEDD